MKRENQNAVPKVQKAKSGASQHEDADLKLMMQFFADEMLPYLGISGRAVAAAPTETVRLELHKSYEDFNLIMEDGSWKHFEFQSKNGGLEDLKRFRVYEANASYQHKVSVTTYVLFSGRIKRPETEFTEGINTYRIQPLIMQNRDAEKEFNGIREKIQNGGKLTKADLVPMALTPLMGGEMTQKERIMASLEILREYGSAEVGAQDRDCIEKLEAVIYTMAEKFLDNLDMEDVKKGVAMTRLGQMLVEEGMKEGEQYTLLESIRNLMETLKLSADQAMEALRIPAEEREKYRTMIGG
ncbi:MAG: hypothetical protein LIO86_07900 [Lachnospiraceae bacterium]|nr:hypothetical protein [Lachnospiraceae bacterium]